MRRLALIASVGLTALAGVVTLAVAQDDPIGAVIDARPIPGSEEPPPAAKELQAVAPPVAEPKVEIEVTPPPAAASVAKAPEVLAPDRRPRYPIAVIQAMDKVTAESIRFEARIDRPVQYKSLIFTVRACEGAAEDETSRDAIANIDVQFQPPTPPNSRQKPALRPVFRGWMFAASPSLSPLEHPVYDAWLIACKAVDPVIVPGAAPAPRPRPKAPAPKVWPRTPTPDIAPPSNTL